MIEGFTTMGDGCSIAWEQTGVEGPALILSNSLGTAMDMWKPQMDVLYKRFRIIRYDTRGHGRSDVPAGAYGLDRLGRDVLELANDLEIERFAFCGLSLGGMIGQWLGLRAPERVSQLVIANSSPFMGPPSAWDARIKLVLSDGMDAIVDGTLSRWFTQNFIAETKKTEEIRNILIKTDPVGYAGCCAAIRDMDMRPVLKLIHVPTLIVGGKYDPATPPEHTYALRDGIAGAQCVMLEAAHLANIEQAENFTKVLLEYFK